MKKRLLNTLIILLMTLPLALFFAAGGFAAGLGAAVSLLRDVWAGKTKAQIEAELLETLKRP